VTASDCNTTIRSIDGQLPKERAMYAMYEESRGMMDPTWHEVFRDMIDPTWWTVPNIIIAVCFAVIFGAILKGIIDEVQHRPHM
jgi:hypothetical protein